MTSGKETEWVYSYNPGARTGLFAAQTVHIRLKETQVTQPITYAE